MFIDWLETLALLIVHLGFAALLGLFARQLKTRADRALAILGGLVYFGSSLGLPLLWSPKLGIWLASAALFAAFAKLTISAGWQARLIWLYAGVSMLLILAWSVTQGWPTPTISLGFAAAWAGLLAWRRGMQLPH
ncbi:MAG: hypothetical protein WD740_04790 [Anaerolineales bacterium]